MSLIGRKPISLEKDVEVNVQGSDVTVKGPKGSLSLTLTNGIQAKVEGEQVLVTSDGSNENKKFHGLYRSLIHNNIQGVSKGFSKKLLINGVGYRVNVQGDKLVMNIGFCHPVELKIPEGIKCEVAKSQTEIDVSGIDKQKVGEFAANIRKQRPPEPYKGKGIRYSDEVIRRKAGKAMA
jgi:large subunit ribosomal protein L6